MLQKISFFLSKCVFFGQSAFYVTYKKMKTPGGEHREIRLPIMLPRRKHIKNFGSIFSPGFVNQYLIMEDFWYLIIRKRKNCFTF